MSRRRNTNMVTTQILKVCKDGASKTRIIYQANLNSIIGTNYLDDLTKKGFIEAIPDGARFIYKTTAKGLDLQEKLGQYQNIMESLNSKA
jgi:predicted transcriptional regulator